MYVGRYESGRERTYGNLKEVEKALKRNTKAYDEMEKKRVTHRGIFSNMKQCIIVLIIVYVLECVCCW